MKTLLISFLLFSVEALADRQIELVRRLAVFPIAGLTSEQSEDAWWQSRELLTKDQRFFVASRRMMINRGAFQPRKNLKPADAIILGKILDAEALVTMQIENRLLIFKVYETESGQLYFETKFEFHPAISVSEQLPKAAAAVSESFLRSQPFHGFLFQDSAHSKIVYEIKDKKMVSVFKGSFSVEVGDEVQFIKSYAGNDSVMISTETKIEILAVGKVLALQDDKAQVELIKMTEESDIKDLGLVRFPKLVSSSSFEGGNEGVNLTTEYLTTELKNVKEHSKAHGPTPSSLAWIFNIVAVVLLAF